MPTPFRPADYGPSVAVLLSDHRIPDLGPGSPVGAMRTGLTAFDPANDLGRPVVDAEAARACQAGLWLLFDFLDESHTISQDLSTTEGSYWHAVMHRREPDASNSMYWWRRVGDHPLFPALAQDAAHLGYGDGASWDPAQFVDSCERERGSGRKAEQTLRRVARREWELLFDWCWRKAIGL